jgi:hypothetical protein
MARVRRNRDERKARFFPQTAEGMKAALKHLENEHGIDPIDATELLHQIKGEFGFGGADNVAVDWTGNVYSPVGLNDPTTRQWLGSLTERGKRRSSK